MSTRRKDVVHTLEEWNNYYYSKYAANEGWNIATPVTGGNPELVIIDSTLCNMTDFQLWHYLSDLWTNEGDMLAYSALNIIKHTNKELWTEITNQTNVDTVWEYYDGSPYVAYIVTDDDEDTVAVIMGTGERIFLHSSINYRSGRDQFLRMTGYHEVVVLKDDGVCQMEKCAFMELRNGRIDIINSLTPNECVVQIGDLYLKKTRLKIVHGKFKSVAYVYCFLMNGRRYTFKVDS